MQLRSRWRAEVLPSLRGDVVDVGAGEGHGLHQLSGAARVTCVEPRAASVRRLRSLAARRPGLTVHRGRAERLPLDDAAADSVVCCAVLCSVDDQRRALAEIQRVLRPGGRLVLFEHVAAWRGSKVRLGQHLVAPLSRLLDRGCHPARDTEESLRASGLEVVELQRPTAAGPWGIPIPHLVAVLERPAAGAGAGRAA